MKKILYFITIAIVVVSFQPVKGQLLNKLRKQVERKSEEHALKEADKAADKGLDKAADAIWDAIEEEEKETKDPDDTTSTSASSEPDSFAKIMSVNSGPPVQVADSYSFDTRVAYEMTVEGAGPNEENMVMEMVSWYWDGKNYSANKIRANQGGQPMDILTVFDMDNEVMIIIMEEQKMAQMMSTKGLEEQAQVDDATQNDVKIKKTGRSKKILGYTSYEYEMQNGDTQGTFWIAPDAKVYSASMFKGGMFGNDGPDINLPKDQQGMLMEMNAVVTDDEGKKSNMKLLVKSIDKKSMTINLSDYQKMNLGGFH